MRQFAYVVKGHQIKYLLGLEAAKTPGILTINPEGSTVNQVETETLNETTSTEQGKKGSIFESTQEVLNKHPSLFDGIGKFANTEINFDIHETIKPTVQRE